MSEPLKILSLGAGVQSSTVLRMSIKGVLPQLDAAIFADTGWEPKAVYAYLAELETEAAAAGIPVYRVSAWNIREDMLRARLRADEYKQLEGGRRASLPLFTQGPDGLAQIQRQCTKEDKIEPIHRQIGLLVEERGIKKTPGTVQQWFGISGDETRRMRISKVRYIENFYPLVFAFSSPLRRHDCLKWMDEHAYSPPPRSACLGCPYHSDDEWRQIKADPVAWADVVEFDVAIRKYGGMRGDTFLHRSCKPLPMVDLETMEDNGQQNWLTECEGMCGV